MLVFLYFFYLGDDISHIRNIFLSLKFSPLFENISGENIQDYIHDLVHLKFIGVDEAIYQVCLQTFHSISFIIHTYFTNV